MAFIDCATYNHDVSADVIYREGKEPVIRAKCGGGYIGMEPAEAVKLRDDLSRAITEAATAAAKAAEVAA